MPDEPEVHGLLALMLLHDSRRAARVRDGELVLLADQDRALWDRAQIDAGRAALDRALARCAGRGPYVAAGRDRRAARGDERRDWPQIAALYGELGRADRLAGGRAQPRRRDRRGGGPEAGLDARRRARARRLPLPARRRAPSCCAVWAAPSEARDGLRARARAGALRAGAAVPRAPAGRALLDARSAASDSSARGERAQVLADMPGHAQQPLDLLGARRDGELLTALASSCSRAPRMMRSPVESRNCRPCRSSTTILVAARSGVLDRALQQRRVGHVEFAVEREHDAVGLPCHIDPKLLLFPHLAAILLHGFRRGGRFGSGRCATASRRPRRPLQPDLGLLEPQRQQCDVVAGDAFGDARWRRARCCSGALQAQSRRRRAQLEDSLLA